MRWSTAKLFLSGALIFAVLAAMPLPADSDFYVIPISSMTFKGDWNVSTTYAAHDVVFYDGSSWFSLVGSNKGNAPDVSPGQWTMLAQKGATGPAGPLNPYITIDADYNTAVGRFTLSSNTGTYNTATGDGALSNNTTGYQNTATGVWALNSNISGSLNTANGMHALYCNTTGSYNTAVGEGALNTNTTGECNTAIGYVAGQYGSTAFTGSNNIYIGYNVSPWTSNESNAIRIGNDQNSATFIRGICGVSISGGVPVLVNSAGQLATSTSSIRYKEEVENMGDASSGLMQLRPVTFYYKHEYANGPRILQYGLIAEEVAQVYPDLVQYNPGTGEPQTVYYQLVNAMLLNEVQKQQQRITDLERQQKSMIDRLAKLEALLEK